jgi:PleD family two-component response regulator
MERIRESRTEGTFFGQESSAGDVTISAGIAVHRPEEDPASLLALADRAL